MRLTRRTRQIGLWLSIGVAAAGALGFLTLLLSALRYSCFIEGPFPEVEGTEFNYVDSTQAMRWWPIGRLCTWHAVTGETYMTGTGHITVSTLAYVVLAIGILGIVLFATAREPIGESRAALIWRAVRSAVRRAKPWRLLGVVLVAAIASIAYQIVVFTTIEPEYISYAAGAGIVGIVFGMLTVISLLASVGVWIILIAMSVIQQRFNPDIAPWMKGLLFGLASLPLFTLFAERLVPGIWTYVPGWSQTPAWVYGAVIAVGVWRLRVSSDGTSKGVT
ncbi:MAG: hypothetical protein ACOYBP_05710 [Microbacteriaceae bacterium]